MIPEGLIIRMNRTEPHGGWSRRNAWYSFPRPPAILTGDKKRLNTWLLADNDMYPQFSTRTNRRVKICAVRWRRRCRGQHPPWRILAWPCPWLVKEVVWMKWMRNEHRSYIAGCDFTLVKAVVATIHFITAAPSLHSYCLTSYCSLCSLCSLFPRC